MIALLWALNAIFSAALFAVSMNPFFAALCVACLVVAAVAL